MSNGIVFSNHAKEMLKERNISEVYVFRAIEEYDRIHIGDDGNTHCFKSIIENDKRVLHVIINKNVNPNKIVTLFYDRKAGRNI